MSTKKWTDISPVSEFAPGTSRQVAIEDMNIAVINLAGEYFAIEDKCTHAGWPMLGSGLQPEDIIEGDQIICPRHGARFCIRTGNPLNPPAYESLACFPVRIYNGMVQTCAGTPD